MNAMSSETEQAPRKATSRQRLFLLAGSLAFSFLCVEVLLRILGLPVSFTPRQTELEGGELFETKFDGVMVYRSNLKFSHVYDPAGDQRGYFGSTGRVTYQINRHGLRGPDFSLEKPDNAKRVLCLGDSFTFGEGVRYEDTYPAVLKTLLTGQSADKQVEVINAGVQAYGTRHAGMYFELRGRDLQPDIVVLGFFLNDATNFFTTIQQHDAASSRDSSSSLAKISRTSAFIGNWWYSRGVQKSYFDTTRASFESEEWDLCKQIIADIQTAAEEDGFRFVVVIFPMLWQLDDNYPFEEIHEKVTAACQEAGCEHIDLLATYRGQEATSLWVHPTDQHPNESAQRQAAEVLAKRLQSPPPQ